MNTTNTMSPGEMTIAEYWRKYGLAIANKSGFQCDGGGSNGCKKEGCLRNCTNDVMRKNRCRTYKSYERDLNSLSEYLTCKIEDITEIAVKDALSQTLKNGGKRVKTYSDQTGNHFLTALKTTLAFAYNEQHINYDMSKILPKSMKATHATTRNRSTNPLKYFKSIGAHEASKLAETYRNKLPARARSMTAWQNEELIRHIRNGMRKTGMAIGLAMMRYGGFRPAEVRALTWKDLKEIRNHPGTYYLVVKDSVNERGISKGRVKQKDSVRPVPVHMELALLLMKRKDYVQKRCNGKKIDDYPICCHSNDFSAPCTVDDFSKYARSTLDSLKLDQRELLMYQIFSAEEKYEDNAVEAELYKPENLCLYVLRKAYCSDLQSKTQLTREQIAYNMGHAFRRDGKDLRQPLNEDTLWEIACKQNSFIVSRELHRKAQAQTLGKDKTALFSNRGIVELTLGEDLLSQGGTVTIDVRAVEAGDDLMFHSELLEDTEYCTVKVERLMDYPAQDRVPEGINMEWATYHAHVNPQKNTGLYADYDSQKETLENLLEAD